MAVRKAKPKRPDLSEFGGESNVESLIDRFREDELLGPILAFDDVADDLKRSPLARLLLKGLMASAHSALDQFLNSNPADARSMAVCQETIAFYMNAKSWLNTMAERAKAAEQELEEEERAAEQMAAE